MSASDAAIGRDGEPGGPGADPPEHVTPPAEPPQSPVIKAVRSLEVRWIFPGQLEAAVAGWFRRFPAAVESRKNTYLLDPQLRGAAITLLGWLATRDLTLASARRATWMRG